MSGRDFGTYMKIFDISTDLIPKPDLLIYLKSSIYTLVRQIRKRGREYEQNIDIDYLKRLNDRYDEWVSNYDGEVFIIDKDNTDFVENIKVLDSLLKRLDQIHAERPAVCQASFKW